MNTVFFCVLALRLIILVFSDFILEILGPMLELVVWIFF